MYDGTTGSFGVSYSSTPNANLLGSASVDGVTSKNVGSYNLSVNPSSLYSNQQGYNISYVDGTIDISKASLIGSITADNKVYNGNTNATFSSRTLSGVVAGDTVSYTGGSATFADRNAANGKAVSATGLGLSGTDAGNYTVNSSATTKADISKASLSLIAASDTKLYDGNTTSGAAVVKVGLVGGDTVGAVSQSYVNKNVQGTNNSTLAVNGGYVVNDGNGGNNYKVTTQTTNGSITPRSLTVVANSQHKIYGERDLPLTYEIGGMGLLAGESLVGGLWAPTMGAATAGEHAITQGTLSGAPNYVITQFTNGTMKIEKPVEIFAPMRQPADRSMDLNRSFNANPTLFVSSTTTGSKNTATKTVVTPNTTSATGSSTDANVNANASKGTSANAGTSTSANAGTSTSTNAGTSTDPEASPSDDAESAEEKKKRAALSAEEAKKAKSVQ